MHKSKAFAALTVFALAMSALFAVVSCGSGTEERAVKYADEVCEKGEAEVAQGPAVAGRIRTHRESNKAMDRYAAGLKETCETKCEEKLSKSADWKRKAGAEHRVPLREPVPVAPMKPQAELLPPQDSPALADTETPDALARSGGFRPFVQTSEDHFSTFSIDVDTAAYALARKYIERGQLPPRDRVRIEEFLNYFKYYYKSPKKGAFAVYIEGAPSIFGQKGHQLLKIGVKTKEVKAEERKDALLTFVIDVSGSMRENGKLEQAKDALYCLIDQMCESDQIGIVIYNHIAQTSCTAGKLPSGRRAPKDLYTLGQLGPGVVGNNYPGLLLNHGVASEVSNSA